MTTNRLDELGLNDDGLYDSGDIEMPSMNIGSQPAGGDYDKETPKDSEFVTQFYADIGEIKGILTEIQDNTKDLEKEYEKSFAQVTIIGEKAKRQKEKLNSLRKDTSSKLTEVRDRLKKIEKGNKDMKKKMGQKYRTAEFRIRDNQYNSVLKEFAGAVNSFQEVENNYKQKKRQEIKRKLEIVSSDNQKVDEGMVDDFLANPRPIFIEKLKGTSTWKTVQTEYELAVETREDLLQLETNMNELVDMFRDMYGLVNMQQDLIDNIENNVQDTIEYVQQGTKSIQKAKKASKRGKCCVFISGAVVICLVMLGIIVAIVVLSIVLK